jgi:hypothetical protein
MFALLIAVGALLLAVLVSKPATHGNLACNLPWLVAVIYASVPSSLHSSCNPGGGWSGWAWTIGSVWRRHVRRRLVLAARMTARRQRAAARLGLILVACKTGLVLSDDRCLHLRRRPGCRAIAGKGVGASVADDR